MSTKNLYHGEGAQLSHAGAGVDVVIGRDLPVYVTHIAGAGTTTYAYGLMSDLLSSSQETALIYESSTDNLDFAQANGTDFVGTNKFAAANATFVIDELHGKLENTASAQGMARLDFTTRKGRTYTASIDVITGDDSNFEFSLSTDTSWNEDNENLDNDTSTDNLVEGFLAVSTTSYLHIRNKSDVSGEFSLIDNIWIRERVKDRSYLDIPGSRPHWIAIKNVSESGESVEIQARSLTGIGDDLTKSKAAQDDFSNRIAGQFLTQAMYMELPPGEVIWGAFDIIYMYQTAVASPSPDILMLIRGAGDPIAEKNRFA